MRRTLTILWLLTGNLSLLIAQDVVRGRLTSTDKQPIHGANIKSPDGTILAISDSLGYFMLKRPTPKRLTASHVAFNEREFNIGLEEEGLVTITMQPITALLEEVEVSTGFQQIPKERATGAFSHIDNETFHEQVTTDVLSRLEAVANGLDIARTTALGPEMGIRIRGISTFTSGSIRNPLIILDDFPYDGDPNNINPNDVENITLLKDAAAASIWGARAGNGVIVITTKRGKQNQPLRIDFNSNMTIGGKPDLSYLLQMSGADFIEMERFLFERNHRFSDTASISRPAFSPAYEIMFRQRRGEISEIQANTMLTNLAQFDVRDQYLKYIYEPSVNQQYALSLQGGNDNMTSYLSAGYDHNKSTLGGKNDRVNINFRNTYTPIPSLRLKMGLIHTQSQSTNGRTGFDESTIPYTRIVDGKGRALPVLTQYRQPFLDTLGGDQLLDWNYYPLTDHNYVDNRSSLSHTLFNVGVSHIPLDWLALDVKYQYGGQQTRHDMLNKEGSYFANDLINRFSQRSSSTGELTYIIPRGSILDLSRSSLQSHNVRGQINANQTWQLHEITALVGVEASHLNTKANGNRTYGYNPDILTFSQVNYLAQFPHFITGSNNFIPQNQTFSDQTTRFISTFANASYTFDTRYTLSLSARSDASNQFGVNFNDRWNLLWSAGLSWETSAERFYHSEALPYLRFRATYGFSGNTDMSRSAITTIQYQGTSNFLLAPFSFVSQDANPELGWERIRMANLGTDFRLKGNRISGSVDFFFKYGTELFGPEPIDPTTGIQPTVIRNASSVRGNGVDVELNSLNVNNRLRWNTNLNFSYYTDKVIKSYRANRNVSAYVVQEGFNRIEGNRMHSIYSYRWGGLDPENGDPIGFIDGEPSKNYSSMLGAGTQMMDLVKHGSSVPLVYGSLGNTLAYRNFGISIRLLYKLGYFFRNGTLRYGQLFAGRGSGQHPEYHHRWQHPGDELITNVPSMVYPNLAARDNYYRFSEVKVERGDNIRLQYINAHYDLEKSQLPLLPFQSVRLYFNIANLGLLWKATDVHSDPDYGAGALPPVTTYSFGLRFGM